VFLGMAAIGALMAVVYWFVSYEAAGSVLLTGFTLACGIIGVRAGARGTSSAGGAAGAERTSSAEGTASAGGKANAGGAMGIDPDRPLLDEHGRVPSPTFAPFAMGVGIALAATALVFGPAPLVVAVVPVAWGAREWLGRASAELDATEADET
jgi:hypothetical protein